MIETLSHFSHKKIVSLKSINQSQSKENGGYISQFKPRGLWLSVDGEDSWEEWCEREGFDGNWNYHYRVELTNPENVLWIKSAKSLLDFTEKFNKSIILEDGYNMRFGHAIDWEEVAKTYSGIIISPYQWSLRLHENAFWYYGWDCASGCIWDIDIIKLTLLDKEKTNGNQKKSSRPQRNRSSQTMEKDC
jgi:hypothetical protein